MIRFLRWLLTPRVPERTVSPWKVQGSPTTPVGGGTTGTKGRPKTSGGVLSELTLRRAENVWDLYEKGVITGRERDIMAGGSVTTEQLEAVLEGARVRRAYDRHGFIASRAGEPDLFIPAALLEDLRPRMGHIGFGYWQLRPERADQLTGVHGAFDARRIQAGTITSEKLK